MSFVSSLSGYFSFITKVPAETKMVSTSSSPPNVDVGEVRNELETMNSLPSELILRPYDASKYSLLVQECIRRLEEYQGKGGVIYGSQPPLAAQQSVATIYRKRLHRPVRSYHTFQLVQEGDDGIKWWKGVGKTF